jgi:hypothetical protein
MMLESRCTGRTFSPYSESKRQRSKHDMRWKLLAECVLVCLVFIIIGYMALCRVPERVGYGLLAFGILVLVVGLAAAYMSD